MQVRYEVPRTELVQQSGASQGGSGLTLQATEENEGSLGPTASQKLAQGVKAAGVDDGQAFQTHDQCHGRFRHPWQYRLSDPQDVKLEETAYCADLNSRCD